MKMAHGESLTLHFDELPTPLPRLVAVPLTLREVNEFVEQYRRHNAEALRGFAR
jgi:hypothetical protein